MYVLPLQLSKLPFFSRHALHVKVHFVLPQLDTIVLHIFRVGIVPAVSAPGHTVAFAIVVGLH